MDKQEMESKKLDSEELDQIAGGSYLDDAIDTVTNTVKKGVAIVNKGIDVVKTSKDAALQAGEAVISKVKDEICDPFGLSKSPVQKHQDDSYKFGE